VLPVSGFFHVVPRVAWRGLERLGGLEAVGLVHPLADVASEEGAGDGTRDDGDGATRAPADGRSDDATRPRRR
jgi:hypothetical protein